MILNISILSENWSEFSLSEPHTHFPGLADLEKSGEARFTSPLAIDLSARITGGQVEVKGTLALTVEQPCGRCLEPFSGELSTTIELYFADEADHIQSMEEGDEVELTEEALSKETFSGDRIDLTQYLQDEVVMALPLNPTCRETCKGLCRECGMDLNKGACGCDTSTCHPAFAKLKVLKGGK
ncbi:hypothetical protein DSLASN_33940 [Desulfoluna limicola]|uniref:DUF177 domain-containing protein n=1 Tax=Desulfoluna limicola TaxID=2810562 RepID=A0ABM7PJN0_9BACT|nr:DUF177 domain-containing protein [Desulfoluna limicola]BCS97762.1 hypothetical protein DSLASN_33940 [Desulfoluna limicola]